MLYPQQPAKNWMSHPFWLMVPNQQLNNDHIQELASLELVSSNLTAHRFCPIHCLVLWGMEQPKTPSPNLKFCLRSKVVWCAFLETLEDDKNSLPKNKSLQMQGVGSNPSLPGANLVVVSFRVLYRVRIKLVLFCISTCY